MKYDKKDVIATFSLIALSVLLWLPRLQGPIDLRWDGGAYFVLGTSLAQGKGYRLLNEPGEIQSTLHPPVLPVMVALHQWILGSSDPLIVGHWLRLFYFGLFVLYALAVYVLLRKFLPSGYAFFASVVCLLQLHTVFMSDLGFPELPFELVTVVFAILNVGDWGKLGRFFRAPLAIIAYGLRAVGVALLAAWVLESLCQKRLKQFALRLPVLIIPVLCWNGYVRMVESGQEYQHPAYEYQRADYVYINVSYARNMKYKDPFSPENGYASLRDKAGSFAQNLAVMPIRMGEAVSTKESLWDLLRSEANRRIHHSLFPPLTVPLLLLMFAAFIAMGMWRLWREQHQFIPLYVVLSLVVISTTPWPVQFNRYLSPLSPFLSLALFLGIKAVSEKLSGMFFRRKQLIRACLPWAVGFPILIAQVVTLFLTSTQWHQQVSLASEKTEGIVYRQFFYDRLYKATDAGLDWLKLRAQPGEILAATGPQWAYLRTGLKSVLPPLELDANTAQRLLDTVPVKYLIVDEGDFNKYTTNVIAKYPELWRKVFSFSDSEVEGSADKHIFEIYERTGDSIPIKSTQILN